MRRRASRSAAGSSVSKPERHEPEHPAKAAGHPAVVAVDLRAQGDEEYQAHERQHGRAQRQLAFKQKGVRNLLCEASFGPFRQKVPDTFLGEQP